MAEADDALARTATSTATPAVAGQAASRAAARQLGRYQLERELGAGGMGVVHAAFDPELERRVAIKLLLCPTEVEGRQRFLREARALARLTHPNVVTVYEVGSHQGHDYIAMELVEGASLADWLRSERRSEQEIVAAFVAAARGLAAAHAANLVHRDFKPHNVLRSRSGRVLVTDFGLACIVESCDVPTVDATTELVDRVTLTVTGSWVGTPAYMAPEQWRNGTIEPATDQFAFCIALWEALAGERPFRGETTDELRAAAERGPAGLDMTKIPRRYRALLQRGLDPVPAQRWPDMDTVADLLEARTAPPGRRAWIVGGLLALVVVAAAVLAVVAPEAETSREPPPAPTTPAKPASAEQLAEGEKYFAHAQAAMERGDFETAATSYERAYVHLPRPAFLFNAAQMYRKLADTRATRDLATTDLANALRLFRRYLQEEPDAAQRVEVEQWIPWLENKLADRSAKTVTPAPSIQEIQRFSDGHVAVPSGAIARIVEELHGRTAARLVPTVVDDVPIGLKLFALRAGTFLDAIGLANGDVLVAIDGQQIRTADELAAALRARSPEARELRLELLRIRAPLVVTIRTRDRTLPD